jgi:hypothetical protein
MEDKRMSEQNPYTKLEVPEDASFEEIQSARDRLIERHPEDERSRQEIEAAYDAILMDRLRKRQEGKIAVPEGVRLAEQMAEKMTKVSTLTKATEPPLWLKQLIDKPGLPEVLTATGVFTLLGSFAIFNQTSPDSLSFLLALGVGFTMYWLNRKEQRLGRSFLLTLGSLAIGFIVGSLLLQVGLATVGLTPIAITTLVILVFFWLTGTFLR